MPNLSFGVISILLSLGHFTAVVRSGSGSLFLHDILIIGFAIFYSLFLLIRGRFRIPKYLVLFLIFALFSFITLLVNSTNYSGEIFVSAFYYWLRFTSYLLFSIGIYNLVSEKKRLFAFMVVNGLLFLVFGFIQLLVLPDFRVLNPELGYDPHINRLASTIFDPNFVGAIFVICFSIVLNWFSNPQNKKALNALLLILFFIGVFFTFSRSAWAMLGVVVFVYGVFKYRQLLILSILLFFLAYFAVPRVQTRISGITDPADSAYFRLISWQQGFDLFKASQAFGVGFNYLREAQKSSGFFDAGDFGGNSGAGIDSSLLFAYVTTGVFGGTVFLIGLAYPIFDSFYKKTPNLLVISVLIGLLLESTFINSLFLPQIMFMYFSILALES